MRWGVQNRTSFPDWFWFVKILHCGPSHHDLDITSLCGVGRAWKIEMSERPEQKGVAVITNLRIEQNNLTYDPQYIDVLTHATKDYDSSILRWKTRKGACFITAVLNSRSNICRSASNTNIIGKDTDEELEEDRSNGSELDCAAQEWYRLWWLHRWVLADYIYIEGTHHSGLMTRPCLHFCWPLDEQGHMHAAIEERTIPPSTRLVQIRLVYVVRAPLSAVKTTMVLSSISCIPDSADGAFEWVGH